MKSFLRKYPDSKVFKNGKLEKEYDAYKLDIASVQIFFDTPTVFQYVRQPRLTW